MKEQPKNIFNIIMNYNKYLDNRLIEQIKEQIEEREDNVFALVLINDKSVNFENVLMIWK